MLKGLKEYATKEDLYEELRKMHERLEKLEANQKFFASERIKETNKYIDRMIAQRQQAEKELEMFFDLSTDFFLITSLNGKIKQVNKNFAETVGYTGKETIPEIIRKFAHPDDLEILLQDLAKGAQEGNGQRQIMHRYCKEDGAYQWILWNYVPVPEEDLVFVVGRNITDFKESQDTIIQSGERLFSSFHGSPVIMAVVSLYGGRIIDINDYALLEFNVSRDQVINRTLKELNFYADLEKRMEYRALVKEKGRVDKMPIEYHNLLGEKKHGLFWLQLIYIEEQPACLAALIDVTEHTLLQKEMAQIDRLNIVGEMAASIGHEIRNPLTTVRGFLQMISSRAAYNEDQEYFELMIEELDRANEIISEYLRLAKNKRVDLRPKYFDAIIRSLSPMITADANYRGISLKLDLGCPPRVMLDENEIRQMILNLSRNGLEAMSTGGTLTIGTFSEDNDVIMYLKDEGKGIDSRLKDKIGTPFFTTKENGTGLGLAVCYSIAARHNAKIDFDTGPGGTVFKVRFPAVVEMCPEDTQNQSSSALQP